MNLLKHFISDDLGCHSAEGGTFPQQTFLEKAKKYIFSRRNAVYMLKHAQAAGPHAAAQNSKPELKTQIQMWRVEQKKSCLLMFSFSKFLCRTIQSCTEVQAEVMNDAALYCL